MNARASSVPQRLRSASDVLFRRSAECRNFNFSAFDGDSPDCCEVTFGRDWKACFDDIDTEILKLLGYPDLLIEIHRAAGRLFAVTQGCIKDADSGLCHGISSCGQAGEKSYGRLGQ